MLVYHHHLCILKYECNIIIVIYSLISFNNLKRCLRLCYNIHMYGYL